MKIYSRVKTVLVGLKNPGLILKTNHDETYSCRGWRSYVLENISIFLDYAVYICGTANSFRLSFNAHVFSSLNGRSCRSALPRTHTDAHTKYVFTFAYWVFCFLHETGVMINMTSNFVFFLLGDNPASEFFIYRRFETLCSIFISHVNNKKSLKPTKQRAEGGDLRFRARRLPSACLAIPALNAYLGSVTDTLNYNWDYAYLR
jgi:hypothetical protein